MPVWEEDETTFSGLKANFTPLCFFHRDKPTEMKTFDIKLLHFALRDGKPGKHSNAIDVVIYCPYCGADQIYGVAISPEHGERMKKKIEEYLAKKRKNIREKIKKLKSDFKKDEKIVLGEEEGIQLEVTPGWDRTNDIQGHKPKFEIRCYRCEYEGIHTPMRLRHSVINTEDEEGGIEANVMSYKCPRCAWFTRFYVLDEKKYLKKVVKKYRQGYRKFLPDNELWSEEDELIKMQLAALGYWGGREDAVEARNKLISTGKMTPTNEETQTRASS